MWGFRVLGFRVWRFRAVGFAGCRGLEIWGVLWFRAWGFMRILGFRVWGFRVRGLGVQSGYKCRN